MRFVKTATVVGPRIGVLLTDSTVAVSAKITDLDGHLDRLGELGAEILDASDTSEMAYAALELLQVVNPPSMRDFMAFEEHALPSYRARGSDRLPDVWYQQPVGYFSNAAAVRGPVEPIEIPADSTQLDFELEIGAIARRSLSSVDPAQAADAIAGFLVLCDWSARDLQSREMQGRVGPHKGKDFASSVGPLLVTPDELEPWRDGAGYDLLMTSSVNGRQYGSDRWSSVYWSFEELISYSSWSSIVEAGALIGSGTCQGGCIAELALRHSGNEFPWLTAGDKVTLRVEQLGEISVDILPSPRGGWPGERTCAYSEESPDGAESTQGGEHRLP